MQSTVEKLTRIVCMYILSSLKRHRPWNPLWRVIFLNCLSYGIYLHLYPAANIEALPRISWSCDIARHESIFVRYHNNRTDTKIVGLSRCNHLVYKILPKGHINVYTDSLNLTISGVMFSISKNNTWSGNKMGCLKLRGMICKKWPHLQGQTVPY